MLGIEGGARSTIYSYIPEGTKWGRKEGKLEEIVAVKICVRNQKVQVL